MRGDMIIGKRVLNIPLLTASAIFGLGIGVGTGLTVVAKHKASVERSIEACVMYEDEQICEARYKKNMALIEITNIIRDSIFGSKK
jgi:tetrahydromethanopterin S-methyltransferase subunit D